MPEHGEATPRHWRLLESFLWHDFPGADDWAGWAGRCLADVPAEAAEAGVADAMRLHAALRSLQAANSGVAVDVEEPRTTLNRMAVEHGIRPHLDRHGSLRLIPAGSAGPAAPLLVLALDAMQADAWRRFKLCREPVCRASFFDGSKAAAKTWCAMRTCGSRNKMRRYRARP